MARKKISAIVITKNEAARIEHCLDSIDFCDEIIVVDSGSIDGTVEICKEKGARVFSREWPGFGPQKQFALEQASCEWVLSVDADEQITPELRQEIIAAVSDAEAEAYTLSRHSSYCGQFIEHSGWRPDHVLRLFRREKGRFSEDQVHEKIIVSGTIGQLQEPLLHYSYDNLEQVLQKVDQFSTLWAQQMHGRGRRSSIFKAVLKGFWAFVRTFLLRFGFLDGRRGLMLAISNAEGAYYKYAKLALLSEETR